MKPLGILGVILIIGGVVVLALKGISYTKDKDSVKVGGRRDLGGEERLRAAGRRHHRGGRGHRAGGGGTEDGVAQPNGGREVERPR